MDLGAQPEIAVALPITFTGESTGVDSYLPDAFLKELTSRRFRSALTDEETLRFARSCLRGDAARWDSYASRFTGTTQAARDHFNTWEGWHAAFKQHYKMEGTCHNVNWATVLVQYPKESANQYFMRITEQMERFIRSLLPAMTKSCTANITIAGTADFIKSRMIGGTPEQNLINDGQIDIFAAQYEEECARHLEWIVQEVISNAMHWMRQLFARQIWIDGLHGLEMRKYATELERATPNTALLWDKISLYDTAASTSVQQATNHKNAAYLHVQPPKKSGKVSSVDVAPSAAQPSTKPQDAQTRPGKGPAAKKPDGTRKYCTFCKVSGHEIHECNSKKKAEAYFAALKPPTQHAASIAVAAQVPGNDQAW